MKNTNKKRLETNLKRSLSLGLSIVMSFAILMANGCNNKPAVIEDYPEVEVTPVEEVIEEVTPVEDEVAGRTNPADDPNREYDSIYETGSFVFNPEAISIQYT